MTLILTLTLTQNLLNPIICVHTVDTQNFFSKFNSNFLREEH